MGITLKDIAKMANVSHMTVSRAINNSPNISFETKKKILELVKQYHYVPNENAKSLVLSKSNNIGLFFSSIKEGSSVTFFSEIIQSIHANLKAEYKLVIRGMDECKILDSLNNKNYDGIIVVSQKESDKSCIDEIINRKIPLVVTNRNISNKDISNIFIDDQKGAFDATVYFIENNHSKLCFIGGNTEYLSTEYRKKGFLDACEVYKIKEFHIIEGNYTLESGFASIKKLLELSVLPTAILCGNDEIALGAIKAINYNNLKIPDDISVIGFDDSIICRYTTPELTSVKKDSNQMGKKAILELIKMIENQEYKEILQEKLSPLVIKRSSVKKIIKL